MAALIILRILFILVISGLSVAFINTNIFPESWGPSTPIFLFAGMITLAVCVILTDIFYKYKKLDVITSVYFGLIVGFFLSYMADIGLTPFYNTLTFANLNPQKFQDAMGLVITVIMCYVSISFLLQTRDNFRFIIPFVEFSKELKGQRPYILDTSVVIDGRISDLVATQMIETQLIMPQFIIQELQHIAASSDKIKRVQGQRGLDILNQLRKNPDVDLKIYDHYLPDFNGQPVEMQLVLLAKHLEAKLATNDYNLNKVARLNGVGVLNLNDLANALKPAFIPGEIIDIHIIKQGEEPGQGVGYLSDGTMVVVEAGRPFIGKNIQIMVTSVLQTSAGRMIFGKPDNRIRPKDNIPDAL
ncbi:MAG: TRAM domain-containing protein [Planctomycetia bacterium]|nr:TRAM domain-containing protein [Planctomycetia bacterium]